VIDDGSTDDSVDVLNDLVKAHSFTFISQKNMGICKTLNKAVRQYSKGSYLALLGSDDYWHPEKIFKQMEELKKNEKSKFCFTQAVEFDSLSGKELRVFPQKNYTGKVLNKIFLRQPFAAGSLLFSRDLFELAGGFDESLTDEDWDFSIRCASLTEFSFVKESLFYYRSHDLNTMKTLGRRKVFQQKAKVFAKNYHLVTPRVWIQAVLLHFIFDHALYKLNIINLKRFLQ
jgi:alpha-1,3-rhamnosyltransferase